MEDVSLLQIIGLAWVVAAVIVELVAVFCSLYTVDQNELAVVERFGKFVRTASPGLNIKIPLVEHVRTRDARIVQLDVDIEDMSKATNTNPAEVMALVLTTQYFDTLKSICEHGKSHTLLLSHQPGAVADIQSQLMTALLSEKKTEE